jgi:hypothetical protein
MNMITAERLREVLDYNPETGALVRPVSTNNRWRVGETAGYVHHSGYVYIRVDGRDYPAHRLAWLWMISACRRIR